MSAEQDMSYTTSLERLIIYCIGSLNKSLRHRVDIQKILFLLFQSWPALCPYIDFQKHKKGPYSELVDEDLNLIYNSGFMNKHKFELSDRGLDIFKIIDERIDKSLKDDLDFYKEFVLQMSEDELLTFIYVKYPEYRDNSEVWSKLEPHRIDYAVAMVKKEVITVSAAAVIADMNYCEFEDELKIRKIRWKS